MKYMQGGGFQKQPLMRLTLTLTLALLIAFWITNFAFFFSKMSLAPGSIAKYYLGSEEEFRMPRTYLSMLEVTHTHLPMMALVTLLLTHLLIFAPFRQSTKVAFIIIAFGTALFNEAAGWLVRFVHPAFSWMKICSFVGLQATMGFLLASLVLFLWRSRGNGSDEERRELAQVERNVESSSKIREAA